MPHFLEIIPLAIWFMVTSYPKCTLPVAMLASPIIYAKSVCGYLLTTDVGRLTLMEITTSYLPQSISWQSIANLPFGNGLPGCLNSCPGILSSVSVLSECLSLEQIQMFGDMWYHFAVNLCFVLRFFLHYIKVCIKFCHKADRAHSSH